MSSPPRNPLPWRRDRAQSAWLRAFAPRALAKAAVALLVFCAAVRLCAHVGPDEHLVKMFVSRSGSDVSVLVRIPVELLGDAGLRMEAAAADADVARALAVITADVTNNLELQQAGVLLPAPRTRAVVSNPGDNSFDSFAAAQAHMNETSQPGTPPAGALVDIQLTYPMRMDAGGLSARLNTLRAQGKTVRTNVQFLTEDGSPRTFSLVGAPLRVVFDPSVTETMREFALRALAVLQGTADWLLLAICLAVPRRAADDVKRATMALLAAEIGGLVLAALGLPAEGGTVLGLLAASTLIVLALHAAVGSSGGWLLRLAVLAGLLIGLIAGQDFRNHVAFAGDHRLLAFATFAVMVAGAQLWVVGMLRAAAGIAYKTGLPERLAALSTAVVVCHFASHSMMDRAGSSSTSALITAAWVAVLAITALLSKGGSTQAATLRRPEGRTT